MTFLVGQTVLEIKAGAPNNGRGEDNLGMVKQFRVGRSDIYPYVSAQASRRWLRDSLPPDEAVSPVTRSGEGKKQQAYTAGRPDLYLDDDLFGYMIAVKSESKTAKKGESNSFMRDTVLATGTLVAVVPNRPVTDFGTMSRGFGAEEHPVIHEHQMYTANLAGDLLLDLPRVGTFEIGGKSIRPALPAPVIEEASERGAEPVVLRGRECLRLPMPERRRRVAVLLRTMASVKGGAKWSAHYGDRTPGLVLLAPIKGGTNPFTRVVREKERATFFDADVLREESGAWADELDGPVRVGWAPGFLGVQRERAQEDLADLVHARRVTLDHPRTMLRTLADEFAAGEHDDWLDDPTAPAAR